ncbi:MAG: PQQ-binding-like beta-propeller repeat protein, partial [Candidatus Binatia bacterium]
GEGSGGIGAKIFGAVSAEVSSEWDCPHWGMYGRTLARTFATDSPIHRTDDSAECASTIDKATVPLLFPLWVVKTPRTVTASPAVVDGVVYVGAWDGVMYAFDAETGATRWKFQTEPAPGAAFGPIVSSAAVADVPFVGGDRRLVIFGSGPRLYALDADADDAHRVAWVRYLGALDGDGNPLLDEDFTEIESSPAVWNGVVYVGLGTHNHGDDESGGVRGGMLALDATTGAELWRFEPETAGGNAGFGCGGVWGSPTIDVGTGTLFFGLGNCDAKAADGYAWNDLTEAVIALDAADGSLRWSFAPHAPYNGRDEDFGATPNLYRDRNGRKLLGAGGKDAVYYALDPERGSLVWKKKVAEPGYIQDGFAVGGFIGSTAVSRGNVFGGTAIGGPLYYHSLDGTTGALRWQGLAAFHYAPSAAVNGVVFAGALDDLFKAFDQATGLPLFVAPLLGPVSSGPAIVGDAVYVGSGTSSSDLCGKDTPVFSELCLEIFDGRLGATGGVHAFRLPRGGVPPIPRIHLTP